MTLGQMKRPWVADVGPNRYRRGLYTYFWRATPHPFLTTFDAPGGVQSCTRRLRSNTPLQALTLLNDPALIEIALGSGRAHPGRTACPRHRPRSARARVRCSAWAARRPTASSRCSQNVLEQERAELILPRVSRRLEKKIVRGPSQAVLSPWVTVARVLLNLDEFVTRE